MRVVVGWMASCHDLPLDQLDDVQLAIETLLAEEALDGEALSLAVSVDGGIANITLEGLQNRAVEATLVGSEPFEPSLRCPLDVRVLLDALVNEYSVVLGQHGSFGVSMKKRIG